MADKGFYAKLGLKDEEFRKKLQQIQKSMGNFANSVKALAGPLAAAFSVGAIVNFGKQVMLSTEQIADAMERFRSGAAQAFDSLKRSLANMDFSNLIQGFRDAFREGERYASVLDEIEDRERSLGIRKVDIEGQILDQKKIAKAAWSTMEQKTAAIDEIIRLTKLERDETLKISQNKLDNELTNAALITKANKDMILDMVSNYDNYIEKIDQAKTLEADLNKLIIFELDNRGRAHQNLTAYNKALSELTPEQKQLLEILNVERNLLGEKRDLIAAAAVENITAVNAQKSGELELQKLRNSLYNEFLGQKEAENKILTEQSDLIDEIALAETRRKEGFQNTVIGANQQEAGTIADLPTDPSEVVDLDYTPSTDAMDKYLEEREAWVAAIEEQNQRLAATMQAVGMAFVDAMAEFIKGEATFGDTVKSLLIEIVKIIAGYLATSVAASFAGGASVGGPTAPFTGAAAAAAAAGLFGALVPALMAEGGRVPSGYPNDSYPAMLTSGETVVPPHKLGSMGGQLSGEFIIKGSDLVYIVNRESNKLARNR